LLGGTAIALAVGVLIDWRRTLQYVGTGSLLFTALLRTTKYSKPQVGVLMFLKTQQLVSCYTWQRTTDGHSESAADGRRVCCVVVCVMSAMQL